MKKKLLTALALTLAAVTLVVCSVWATVAFLTASSGVSNVFTIGEVGIKMFESKVDEKGVPVTPTVEVDANSYHLSPNSTYTKDPTIRITSKSDSDSMYLLVKSSNQIRAIEAGNNGVDTAPTMRKQMEENGWVEFIMSGDRVEIVWVYGTRDPVTGVITPTPVDRKDVQQRRDSTTGPAGEFRLCDEFTIYENADISLYGAASVNFTAFAIQSSAIEPDTKTIWDEIKDTYPYSCGIVSPVNPYTTVEGADPYAPVPGTDGPVH